MSRTRVELPDGFIIAGYDAPMGTWYAQLYDRGDSPLDAPRAVIGYHPAEVEIGRTERPDMRVVGSFPIRQKRTLLDLIYSDFHCDVAPEEIG